MASEDGSSTESPRARQRRQASKPGVPNASPRSTFGDDHTFEREKDLESLTVASVPSLVADARKDDAISNERAAEALHHLVVKITTTKTATVRTKTVTPSMIESRSPKTNSVAREEKLSDTNATVERSTRETRRTKL